MEVKEVDDAPDVQRRVVAFYTRTNASRRLSSGQLVACAAYRPVVL